LTARIVKLFEKKLGRSFVLPPTFD